MALSKFDFMWRIMSDHELDFSADSSYKDLLCAICNKVMVNAVLSSVCDCQYCYKCISEYMNGEERHCPGGKEDCKYENIVINKNIGKTLALDERVSKLKVKCPNECCECYLEFIEVETHLRLCTKQPMECPYVAISCGNDRANKESIITHLHSDTMTHSEKEELRTKEDRITKLEENMKDVSEKSESVKVAVIGELLNKENIIMTLEEKLGEMKIRINRERNERKEEVNNLKIEIEEVRIEGEKERTIMTNEIAILREESKRNEKEVNNLRNKEEETEARLDRWNKLCSIIGADFVWRIEKISKTKKHGIFSEPFYHNSYKLRLWVGYYKIPEDIMFYCHIMMGDNDDNVQWPMMRSITISIVDQYTLRTHTSQTYQSNFNRPTIDKYQPVGPLELKNSPIKEKSSIIINDSIIVSVVVSPL